MQYIDSYRFAGVSYEITELDELEHDTLNAVTNSICRMDDTHFIVAYDSNTASGVVKSFSVDGSYNITEIDSVTHNANRSVWNSICKIDATHFALVYRDVTDGHGYLKTFSVDGSWNITQTDSLLFYSTITSQPMSVALLDATHLVVAFCGAADDGFVSTFSFDGSYVLTAIDELEHDTVQGKHNSVCIIDSTHFAIAYEGSGNNGNVSTFSVNGSYVITEIDSLEHDTGIGQYNSIFLIDSTHLGLSYGSASTPCRVKTFSFDGSYSTITQVDSLNLDATSGIYTSSALIDSSTFATAFQNNSGTGQIALISIDGSYNLANEDEINHSSESLYASLALLDSTHLVLAYAGSGSDGYVSTFEVTIP